MSWLAAPPKSLGEAAQREALRRQMTPKSRTLLTNAGQRLEIPLGAAVAAPPATAGEPPPATPPGETVVKDEKWWRNRITTANESLKRDQDAAEALQGRINLLQRDVVNVDDPIRQTALREELKKTLEELGRAQKLIEDDRKAIVDIQDDARRQNVPAGWIR
jgi:hypothetical protein